MQTVRNKSDSGFTLIELMLAMTFLASILLFSTLAFVQALNTYNKGLTIKQINETGRALTADLNRSANGAKSLAISAAPNGKSPQFMCIGKTAYIWNIEGGAGSRTYVFSDTGQPISIVRTNESVDARMEGYCMDSGPTQINRSKVSSLVGNQASVLDVSIAQPDLTPSNDSLNVPLVRFTITIGTNSNDGAIDPFKPGGSTYWQCPAGNVGSFCSVGTYSTTIYLASGA